MVYVKGDLVLLFLLEMVSPYPWTYYVAQADLEFNRDHLACICLPSAGITCMSRHTQLEVDLENVLPGVLQMKGLHSRISEIGQSYL